MLTKINPDGTWSCRGINMENIDGNLYGALCKIRDYEKSGFEPDDLDRVLENIHVGATVQNYTVFGVWNDCCIAENPNAPDPYVVWNIDRDGFGVNSGRYFTSIDDKRKADASSFIKYTKKNYRVIENFLECIDTAIKEANEESLVLITGSLHFISCVRKIFKNNYYRKKYKFLSKS